MGAESAAGEAVSLFEAILLGVIQGAAEFLPVSSSGHLVMGQALMGLEIPGILFEVVVHLGTLASVLVVYRGRIAELLKGAFGADRSALHYLGLLALATVPAGLAGLFLKDAVESLFGSPWTVGFALLATGCLLFSTRWALRRALVTVIGVKVAIALGLAQAFALIPGISRSGATVVTALWMGVNPVEAAAFSFLMSIPAIAGAGVLMLTELEPGGGIGFGPLLAGAVAAALTGVLAIRTFVTMLKNQSFPAFAWYCWGAGLAFMIWLGAAA